MAPSVPTSEPTTLVAGATWAWDVSYPDFPASEGYELAYYLRGPKDLNITFADHVVVDGDGFEVRVPASASANLPGGTYTLSPVFTLAGAPYYPDDGCGAPVEYTIDLRQNPANSANKASHDERMLDAIDAALEGRLAAEYSEFQVNGRSIVYASHEELLKAQGIYRERVRDARYPGRGFDRREVTFAAPS